MKGDKLESSGSQKRNHEETSLGDKAAAEAKGESSGSQFPQS